MVTLVYKGSFSDNFMRSISISEKLQESIRKNITLAAGILVYAQELTYYGPKMSFDIIPYKDLHQKKTLLISQNPPSLDHFKKRSDNI